MAVIQRGGVHLARGFVDAARIPEEPRRLGSQARRRPDPLQLAGWARELPGLVDEPVGL
jgi:hypothetical protein